MASPPAGGRPLLGTLAVAAAALLWASSGVAGKALFRTGVEPLQLVQARLTLAAGVLFLWLVLGRRGIARLRSRDVAYFAVLGGVALAAAQATYFLAISHIAVAAAILLQYTAPVWVAGFATCWWGERMTRGKLAALLLSLAGAYLVVGGYDLRLVTLNRAGIAAGLASGVSFAAYSLLGERGMHRYPPWTVLFYALGFAAVPLNVLVAPLEFLRSGYDTVQWAGIVYVAVAGTLLPFGLFFVGVNHVRSTRATITATLEPIAAGVLAFALLGERLALPQVLGGALVVGAIVLLGLLPETSDLSPAAVRGRRPAG